MGTQLAELPLQSALKPVPSTFSLAVDDLQLDALPEAPPGLEGPWNLPPMSALAHGLSGTVLLSASADLNALLIGDPCAAPASQGLIHSNSWTSLVVRDYASTPTCPHEPTDDAEKLLAASRAGCSIKQARAPGKCNIGPTGVTVETGAPTLAMHCGGKIKPRMALLQLSCMPAEQITCDVPCIKDKSESMPPIRSKAIGELVPAPQLRQAGEMPLSPFAEYANNAGGAGLDEVAWHGDRPRSLPTLSMGASSDVDVTGLCDAVGVDMADVADAMLAGAAAQMPRLDAGSAGGDELPAVDSPCAADGSGKGNSTSTTYRPNTRLSVVQRELGLTLGSPRAAAATMASALVVDDCDSASGSNRRSRRRRSQPARSGRVAKGSKRTQQTGRPIAFQGDLNSPHITEEERRRIKRRKANRESAARVRLKRQQLVDSLDVQIRELSEQNRRLTAHMEASDAATAEVAQQLTPLHQRWSSFVTDSFKLQGELAALRRALQAKQQAGGCAAVRTVWPAAVPAKCTPAAAASPFTQHSFRLSVGDTHMEYPTFITA